MTWVDGTCYDGEWNLGTACGFGSITYPNGDSYSGYWVNNKANGEGTWTSKLRQITGDWKNDQKHGQCDETIKGIGHYNGVFVANNKQGFGIFSWEDGSRYEGFWHKNKQHGLGTFISSNGKNYQGDWKDGFMDGVGRYWVFGGVTYEGEFF